MKANYFVSDNLSIPEPERFAVTLIIASRLDQIRMVRAAIAGMLSQAGVSECDVDLIGLAVNEVVNNSVEHGYTGDECQQVEIRFEMCNSEVGIEVIDHAPPLTEEERGHFSGRIEPIDYPTEEWPTRGHGLQIVRSIVDSISAVSGANKNTITIKKRVTVKGN